MRRGFERHGADVVKLGGDRAAELVDEAREVESGLVAKQAKRGDVMRHRGQLRGPQLNRRGGEPIGAGEGGEMGAVGTGTRGKQERLGDE